jgi:branched-chain amino acid transport system permease protein
VSDFLTSKPVTEILFGLVNGLTIGLVALSLVLIWRSTRVLNFAQGAMAMFATYVGLGLISHDVGIWWCVLVAVVAGLVLGAVVERGLVRFLYGKPEINPIVVMVGLLLALESIAGAIWSTQPRDMPTPLSTQYWEINHKTFGLSPMAVLEIAVALGVALAIWALFRFTKVGLQLRAAAVAPEVSRLLGVRVSRMLTLGWALSTCVGVIAAILFTWSGQPFTPSLMDGIFVYGFVAAAIGGLESPAGALLAGVVLGLGQSFIQDYSSSNYITPWFLVLLIVVLMIRPQGVFTKKIARRV